MKDLIVKGNWGKLETIPEVSVNKFILKQREYNQVTMFILTHLDQDIVKEILDPRFLTRLNESPKLRLFMHQILYDCLLCWTSIMKEPINIRLRSYLAEITRNGKIILYESNKSFILQTNGPNRVVQVTMVDSGFDLGSVMLLFEVLNVCQEGKFSLKRILYTGNCRVSTKDLKHIPFFWNKNGTIKSFHELYVDTSYLFDEIQELPLREESVVQLIQIIKDQLLQNPLLYFELDRFLPGRFAYLSYLIAKDPVFTPPKYLEFQSTIQDLTHQKISRDVDDLQVYCGGSRLINKRQSSTLEPHLMTKTIVLRQELYLANLNVKCGNIDTLWQPIKYVETNEQYSFGKSLTPSENDENEIKLSYFSHLSRYEIARLIRTLKVPVTVDTIIPLHVTRNYDKHTMIDLVKQSLLEINLVNEERPAYDYEPWASKYSSFECSQPSSIPDMTYRDVYRFNSDGEREVVTLEEFDDLEILRNGIRTYLT